MIAKNLQRGSYLLNLLIYVSLSLWLVVIAEDIVFRLEMRNQLLQAKLNERENLSLVSDVLASSIKAANLNECGSLASALAHMNLAKDKSQQVRLNTAIEVYPATASIAKDWGLTRPGSGQKLPSSPLLVIRSASLSHQLLQKTTKVNSKSLLLTGYRDWKEHDIVLISDCTHLITDRVQSVQQTSAGQVLLLQKKLPVSVGAGGYVNQYQFSVYYLGLDKMGLPGLYSQNLNSTRQEVFADIDNFKIKVGMYDRKSGAWRYLSAEDVQDWQEARILKIGLSIKTLHLPKISQETVTTINYAQ